MREGKKELLELFVKKFGADLNQASNNGMTTVHVAGSRTRASLFKKCVMGARVESSLLEDLEQSVQQRKGLVSWLQTHVCTAPTHCPESASKSCCKQVRYSIAARLAKKLTRRPQTAMRSPCIMNSTCPSLLRHAQSLSQTNMLVICFIRDLVIF